ncbi:uncharacterized protein [Elaeis guineensis]|uniref:Probable pectinesterase/pectinesterase inhibitor 58 n=1 Tax=Elaeis guineensis var. tenera TaxID=51953 RepID=A0A6I9R6H0_ELAGV|nr:probable pectinesterase/pectinesterase inhibitor 58 [Elaeis guineensis]XP_029120773.1 probable pectinesterase/pectinesterase inhibitor 58 [Elaeis guineensis]
MRPGNALLLLLASSSSLLPLVSPVSIPDFRPFHPRKPLPPVNPLIIPFCNKTDYPKICINSARYFSHEFPSIDITNMFNIMARALKDRIRFIQEKALAMSINQKDASVRGSINECIILYNNALDDLSTAMVGFVTRDKGMFETKLNSVITIFKTCNKVFNGNPHLLLKEDERLIKMASNSIAIGKLSF